MKGSVNNINESCIERIEQPHIDIPPSGEMNNPGNALSMWKTVRGFANIHGTTNSFKMGGHGCTLAGIAWRAGEKPHHNYDVLCYSRAVPQSCTFRIVQAKIKVVSLANKADANAI